MSAVRRGLIYAVFSEALDRPLEERSSFLDERCRGDSELRAEVDSLLGIATVDAVETSTLLGSPAPEEQSLAGRTVGRFQLEERIGAGGMGVVYRAERIDGVQQSVAIKLVSVTLADAVAARFAREAQILARLEHPSIARLIDAGIEAGRAWIAMEFVRGERMDVYCAGQRLSTDAIVSLLVELAGAVSTAHAMLVVHSDIKPANVLVTADGRPKLIDFGIATALRDASGAAAPTVDIARLFSPNYAAAEQVTGGAVTVATDVFGLGALAYRLLTGAPIHGEDTSPVAYLLAVTQRDVELPSRAAQRAGRPLRETRLLRGDLDAILCKALERDPAQRYASAAAFRADLQRYLERRPVRARPPSLGYRAAKFARRNALAVGLASLLGVSLIAGGLTVWMQGRSAAVARDMAARRGEFLESVLKSANPREGRRDITVAELLDSSARTLHEKFGAEPLTEASLLGLLVDTNTELGRYPEALAASDREMALLRDHGAGTKDIAAALKERGDLLSRAGKYAEAETALGEAIAVLRRLPAQNAALVDALGKLAGVFANTNREKNAEATLAEAIALDHEHTGFPQHQLAVVLANEGRYADAASVSREALDLQRKYFHADDPVLLTTEATYAMALSNLHRPGEADPLLREVVAASDRVLGPDHPEALAAQIQFGENLLDLDRFVEAAMTLHRAAESLDRTVGPTHRYALGAWSEYAFAACNSHEEQVGLAAEQRVLAIRAKILPVNDWHIAAGRAVEGLCLARLHRNAEAEPMLLQAAADLEVSRGRGFYWTQKTYASLRDLYASLGRTADSATFAAKLDK
jgi:serine/threonine-protein kinase